MAALLYHLLTGTHPKSHPQGVGLPLPGQLAAGVPRPSTGSSCAASPAARAAAADSRGLARRAQGDGEAWLRSTVERRGTERGLSGDLATFDLADVFDWAVRRRKSGILLLARRSTRKRLGLRDGLLRSAWSNDPRESLGQVLIRDRRIGEEALFQALLRQEKEGWLLGEILIGDGVLTADELRRCLQGRPRRSPTTCSCGRMAASSSGTTSRTSIPRWTSRCSSRGYWRRVTTGASNGRSSRNASHAGGRRARRPGRRRRGPGGGGDPAAVDHRRSLAALSMELRRSAFETCLLVSSLHERGSLLVDAGAGRADEEADPIGAMHAQLARPTRRSRKRHFDEAREAFEKVLGLDPLNQSPRRDSSPSRRRGATRACAPRCAWRACRDSRRCGRNDAVESRRGGGIPPLAYQRGVGRPFDPQAVSDA